MSVVTTEISSVNTATTSSGMTEYGNAVLGKFQNSSGIDATVWLRGRKY
jgi:hypothetical protein